MEEEPTEVQCEENTTLPEKNKRRRFKTPAQLQGLEDFYNEHKYPTESMKAELAVKLGLTDKQVSGWFCHRRLKDKRIMNGEINPPGRQDLSSGVIQDRGSGLKQDSCSSTKQGDKLADLREVESRRFCQNGLPVSEINYEQRVLDDGMEMDDTSSESNSDLQESFYPHNRSPLVVETADYRTPNGFVAQNRRRVGPSGYLKIKGQTENVAVTAVKRQLGRQYREDGPPLGTEFDPVPPAAFESPSKNANSDAYGDPEPIVASPLDIGVIHKRHGLNTNRSEDMYAAPTDYKSLHKSAPDSSPYRQSKSPFSNHGRAFPAQKSSLYVDPYSARETSDFDGSLNHSFLRKQDLSGMGSDSYGGKFTSEPEEPLWHNYDNGNSMAIRRRERFDSRDVAPSVRLKDALNKEDRVLLPSRIVKDEELHADRRTISEHHDSSRLKMRRPNELRGGKKGREEFLPEDYPIRPSSQTRHQWSRQIRGSTEMPSSFTEDETAETSCSME